METYKPAPMVCTLPAVDFKGRAQWRNKITRDALIAHQVDGPRARLIDLLPNLELIRNLLITSEWRLVALEGNDG